MASPQMVLLLLHAVKSIYRLLDRKFWSLSHLCIFFMEEKTLGHEFIDLGEAKNSKKNFSSCNS